MTEKRLIFEEVRTRDEIKPSAMMGDEKNARNRLRMSFWLIILFAITVLTVFIGGMTRITDSGLSITEWKPITGILPPFGELQWQAEFEKYQQTPEFNLQNFTMNMSEFQVIYWWEWGHRQLGRLVGLVWFLGFAWFAFRRELTGRRLKRIAGIGGLIIFQGAIGWWMVSSGLTNNALDVAPYRLAIHLCLAFAVAGLVFWEILLLRRPQHELLQSRRSREVRIEHYAGWFIALIALQLASGALVAGLDAGTAFPTWPLMNGDIFPSDSFIEEPWISNFVNNSSLVHFNHRLIGYFVTVGAIVLWWIGRSSGIQSVKTSLNWVLLFCIVQIILGISTALSASYQLLAISHQLGAILLIHVVLWARFEARYPKQIVR